MRACALLGRTASHRHLVRRTAVVAAAAALTATTARCHYHHDNSNNTTTTTTTGGHGHTAMQMTHCATSAERDGSKDIGDAAWRQRLTPQQYRVLREAATDPRGGPLDDFFGDGTYVCAACGATLYTSAMKFACGCGWPGFWDCVPKAVREQPDADGHRSEIVCNACNSHLGHVFRHEHFANPPPNERHCVNSTSLRFVPRSST